MKRGITTITNTGLYLLLLSVMYACSTSGPVTTAEVRQSSQAMPVSVSDRTPGTDPGPNPERSVRKEKDPDDIVPGIVCVVTKDLSEAESFEASASALGYVRTKRRVLDDLGFVMIIVKVPQGYTVIEGIAELRSKFPALVIDANHRYTLDGSEGHGPLPRIYAKRLIGWNPQTSKCGVGIRLGLVDTPVNLDHPHLQGRKIETRSFLPKGSEVTPDAHGTAVATLLVGKSLNGIESGLLPDNKLLVAEIFGQRHPGRIETTTWLITRALDWLVSENVQVINLSFGGPQNALLAFAVNRTLHRNISVVAAAGHGGLASGANYPAAQQGVIAVTALDAERNPYRGAAVGTYIAFSAPGVDIWVSTSNGEGRYLTGTSFAVPYVTASIAVLQMANPKWTSQEIYQELKMAAIDLGIPGWDPVFGWGLIQAPTSCPQ